MYRVLREIGGSNVNTQPGAGTDRPEDIPGVDLRLDHFAGVRIGLLVTAGKEAGGSAEFTRFSMTVDED